jgi:hypothetical protein
LKSLRRVKIESSRAVKFLGFLGLVLLYSTCAPPPHDTSMLRLLRNTPPPNPDTGVTMKGRTLMLMLNIKRHVNKATYIISITICVVISCLVNPLIKRELIRKCCRC